MVYMLMCVYMCTCIDAFESQRLTLDTFLDCKPN